MSAKKIITTPVTDDVIKTLKAGEMIYITGTVYTARDAAHARLTAQIKNGDALPFDFAGQIVYYAGPCPSKPGQVIGSIGPTTSGRMDAYSPLLISRGLKVMIGKGNRNDTVKAAIREHSGVYLTAIGGAGALLAKCVKSAKIIAFDDLATEAVRELYVEEFPVIVTNL